MNPSHHLPLRLITLLGVAFLTTHPHAAAGQTPGEHDKDKDKPKVRIICVASLSEDQEVVIATRSEEGDWNELAEMKLKSPLISDWQPARAGQLHIALREAEGLREIGAFNYPAGAKRAVVVIFPDGEKARYRSEVFDPVKLSFVKGTTLVINYSRLQGAVALGSLKATLKPGESKVLNAQPDANGMFRMLAAYETAEKETVVCYDRYIPVSKESRDILFLLPDPTLGLRVFSLSEFGPFE
jgi:hypothetical protein